MHKQVQKFLRAGVFTLAAGVLLLPTGMAAAQDLLAPEEQPLALPGSAEDSTLQPLLPGADEPDFDLEPPAAPMAQEVDAAPAMPENVDLTPAIPEVDAVANVPDAAPVQEEFNEDLFFDAEALVPQSDLSREGAPSKVDPVLNPGSRLVISRKKANAGSREARAVAAERAMKLGRYESALEIYNDLHTANKRDPNALMGKAIALQRIGRDEEAIEAYEALLALRPKNLSAQVNMQGLLGKRYPAVALRNLLELREQNPASIAVVAQLSVIEAKLGRYDEAIRYLGVAASMEPQNAGHVFNMAVIADRAGDKKQAITYYEEALEIDTLYGSGRSIPRDAVFERLAELR